MIKGTADVVLVELFLLFILSKIQSVFELSGWIDHVINAFIVLIIINCAMLIVLRIREGKWRE